MPDYILQIENATKAFSGLVANEDISFNVERGEIVGVVGPNGAGKTTLFNSISCHHKLTSGKIIFDGKDISKAEPYDVCANGMGRTFQIPQSINDLTTLENVMIGALCHHSIKEAKIKAAEVLRFCEMEQFTDSPASSLNVAQKKRLEIARALATEPKVLLLDETMAGLTATERLDSLKLIHAINDKGITILAIEHNMDVVMSISKRIVVLVNGKVLMIGTPEEVISDQRVIDAYLGGKHKHE